MEPLPVRVLGSATRLPRTAVASTAVDARLGLAPGTTARRHGVERRYVADVDERASALGAGAARAALDAAGLAPDALDAIVSATSVGERALPCTAALIQRELGLGRQAVAAFDVDASCLSFVVALELVAGAIALGRHGTVLICAAELPSVGIDPDDPVTAGLFGDGAAAVVVGRADAGSADENPADGPSALLASAIATFAEHADCCTLPGGGTANRWEGDLGAYLAATRFRMDGPALYRAVSRRIGPFVDALLERAGIDRAGVDLVVPHQGSARALSGLSRRLGFAPERVVDVLAERGNQVAASLPTALHLAIGSGRLSRGDVALLIGTGAGVSIGGAVLRY